MKPQKEKRHYKSTSLSTIKKEIGKSEIELLKNIYSETNSNYRHLADIRFKLLGFVPAVSIIAWAEIIGKIPVDSIQTILLGLVIALLGIIITFGIRIYDKRNDKLYDDLISRGRKIEDELEVDTGIFKGRLEGHVESGIFGKINHGRGLSLIYSSVFTGWGLMVIWFSYNLIKMAIGFICL